VDEDTLTNWLTVNDSSDYSIDDVVNVMCLMVETESMSNLENSTLPFDA